MKLLMTLTLCRHLLQIIVGKSITSSSCDYHLNDRMGKVNPMIIDQDDEIIYPTTSRTLTFGEFDIAAFQFSKLSGDYVIIPNKHFLR